jgi:hypothetical protein
MQLYSEILDAGGPAFGAILRHVRDSPNDPFIFHCTGASSSLCKQPLLNKNLPAGKDRTGIAAALLLLVTLAFPFPIARHLVNSLQLAGASSDAISADYALTSLGRAPMRPLILSRLAREPLFASDPIAAHNMLSSRWV